MPKPITGKRRNYHDWLRERYSFPWEWKEAISPTYVREEVFTEHGVGGLNSKEKCGKEAARKNSLFIRNGNQLCNN